MRKNQARYGLFTSGFSSKHLSRLLLLLIIVLCHSLYAEDWLDKYRPRPVDQLDLAGALPTFQVPTRTIINLNGEWQARESGEDEWQQVVVPGAYNFQGEIEFKRTFTLDSSVAGKAVKLVAFGINNRCTVFINGEFIGSHVGGHTSFGLEVDNRNLKIGESNEIQVRVDNLERPRNTIPLKHSPRTSLDYGGIFRDIFLLALPNIYFEDLTLRKNFSDGLTRCQLEVGARLRNKRGVITTDNLKLQFRVELWDSDRDTRAASAEPVDLVPAGNVTESQILVEVADVQLWSPDRPKLYELRAYLTNGQEAIDEYRMRLGFNMVEVSGNNLMVNGDVARLKGIDLIEGFPDVGPALGRKTILEQVRQMKELGVDAIRVVGAPPHSFLLDACDEAGLFVLQQIPLIFVPNDRFSEKSFRELASNYLKEMVVRDAHHPSLAAWGLGVDLRVQENATKGSLTKLTDLVRSRSDRPTFLIFHNFDRIDAWDVADFFLYESFGEDPVNLESFVNRFETEFPEKLLMCSYGFPYLLDEDPPLANSDWRRNGKSKSVQFSPLQIKYQELQANKLREALLDEELNEKLGGMFVHSITDWIDARPNLFFGKNEDPRVTKSGLVNLSGERRFAYEVIVSELKRNQHIQIPAHELDEDHPIAFPIFGVIVIFVFLFNFNRSRSLRGNIRRIFVYPHGFYMELKEKRKISLFHTFILSLVACAIFGVMVASTAYNLRENTILNEFLSLVIGSNTLKLQLIRLIWHPWVCLAFVTVLAYMIFVAIVCYLKASGVVFGRNLPLIQFYTLVFWAGANFIWLLPVAPIYYRIVSETQWAAVVMALILVFTVWFGARLFRGSKVIFGTATTRVMLLFALVTLIGLSVVGVYYDSRHAFFDYLPTYLSLAGQHYF